LLFTGGNESESDTGKNKTTEKTPIGETSSATPEKENGKLIFETKILKFLSLL
jgi:hypothetical protein